MSSKKLQDKITTIESKIVALAKAQSELILELEQLKKNQAVPVPAVRQNLKGKRLKEVENFYTKQTLRKTVTTKKKQ